MISDILAIYEEVEPTKDELKWLANYGTFQMAKLRGDINDFDLNQAVALVKGELSTRSRPDMTRRLIGYMFGVHRKVILEALNARAGYRGLPS